MSSSSPISFSTASTNGVILSCKKWASESSSDARVPLVLFVHQYAVMGGCGQLMEGMARRVSSAGYDAVTFDLRGAGKSTGSCTYTNKDELNDVLAVLRLIEESTSKNILVVGSSGGAPLAGAVLDSSKRVIGGLFIGYTWGFWTSLIFGWAYASIQRSNKPKLFVVGTNDEFTTMNQYASRIAALSGTINEMRVIEGKNHFEIEAPQYDTLMAKYIIEFLNQIQSDNEGVPGIVSVLQSENKQYVPDHDGKEF